MALSVSVSVVYTGDHMADCNLRLICCCPTSESTFDGILLAQEKIEIQNFKYGFY